MNSTVPVPDHIPYREHNYSNANIVLFSTTANIACRPRFCYLPHDGGPNLIWCKGPPNRWYFNWKTCACEMFLYCGGKGNRNRFSTEKECRSTCIAMCKTMEKCLLKCKCGFVHNYIGCPICKCAKPCKVSYW